MVAGVGSCSSAPSVPRVRVGSALFGPLHLGAMTHMLILICTLTSKTAGTAGVRILASLPVAGNPYTGKSALVGTRSAALDVLRMMLGSCRLSAMASISYPGDNGSRG